MPAIIAQLPVGLALPAPSVVPPQNAHPSSQSISSPPQNAISNKKSKKNKKGAEKEMDEQSKMKLEQQAHEEEEKMERMTVEEALEYFHTNKDTGLTTAEAERRLQEVGPNSLPEVPVNPILQFLKFMWNPLSWSMEVAAILSAIALDFPDLGLILGLLLINSTIAFYEEHQAGNAVAALKAQLAPQAVVLRDNEWDRTFPATQLVPGDIIRLKLGNVVPADAKLIEGDGLKVDQSSLTGESLPAEKGAGEEVFSGSTVKEGEMEAVVVATGMETFFGKAASLVQSTQRIGHFAKVLRSIGLFCITFIMIGVTFVLVSQVALRGKGCSLGNNCSVIEDIVVLVVGGIPIAMPVILSVTMAIGAAQLAKQKAIVTRLTAVEELAGMDMLCSDKTGTLTLNKLTLDTPRVFPPATEDEVIVEAALASKIEEGDVSGGGDAIDAAIARFVGQEKLQQIRQDFEIVHYKPFDPVSKRAIATVRRRTDGSTFKIAKGAPQVILHGSANRAQVEQQADETIDEFASRGLRALGISRMEGTVEGSPWNMRGLIPLFDPPRHDTKETIEKARDLGISVKMITGDQLAIAKETARRLGLGDRIYTSAIFQGRPRHAEAAPQAPPPPQQPPAQQAQQQQPVAPQPQIQQQMSLRQQPEAAVSQQRLGEPAPAPQAPERPEQQAQPSAAPKAPLQLRGDESLDEIVAAADGFAQVFPQHKYDVVESLQSQGHVVGMTGDGVNDAPSLKKADIGIAVADATDAARAASDIVLLAPGLGVIIQAIVGSRKIFRRMVSYSIYAISTTIHVVITFTVLVVAFDWSFPPILIVLLAILNDGTIMTISKDRVKPSKWPDKWNLKEIFSLSFLYGVWKSAASLFVWVIAKYTSFFPSAFNVRRLTDPQLRGFLYLQFAITAQSTIFSCRTTDWFWRDRPTPVLILAFLVAQIANTFIAAFGFGGYPHNGSSDFRGCGFGYVWIAWVYSILVFAAYDPLKFAFYRSYQKHLKRKTRRREHKNVEPSAPAQPQPPAPPAHTDLQQPIASSTNAASLPMAAGSGMPYTLPQSHSLAEASQPPTQVSCTEQFLGSSVMSYDEYLSAIANLSSSNVEDSNVRY